LASTTTIQKAKALEADLKGLRRDIKALRVKQVAKKSLRDEAERLAAMWFSELQAPLDAGGQVSADAITKYSDLFTRLLKLSAPNNLVTSYLETLSALCGGFRPEIVIPLQTSVSATNALATLLSDISSPAQSEYLAEAVSCAAHGLYRGAAVLGWCAAIDQIHLAIQRVGFVNFNGASASMASQTKGRFKKFNQPQNAGSLSELREVFDTVILWIIEGMQLIDSNEHTRLRSCFELRSQCAHPGEAPVTEYNLLSFFSDLDQIVFNNSALAP
jgi:hypothetical protein